MHSECLMQSLSHNSTKYDDPDVTRLQDLTKMVSTVLTRIDTYKATSPNYNSTFVTNYQTSVQDKEKKLCKVKVCEDGTTSPEGLLEAFNCSDIVCLLTSLAGPRDDGCWVENTRLCMRKWNLKAFADSLQEVNVKNICREHTNANYAECNS